MIRNPPDIKEKTGMYFNPMVIKTDNRTMINIGLDFLDGGTIIAMNIAYKAIPIALLMDKGNDSDIRAPIAVPKVQPAIGPVINPSIKA